MHLFLRKGRLPPAEIRYDFGTMREGFPCPETRHSRQRIGIGLSPIHRAWLLLHDPPATMTDAAIEIMVEGGIVRIALPKIEPLDVVGFVAGCQMPDRVGIPGGDIERVGHIEMVELGI